MRAQPTTASREISKLLCCEEAALGHTSCKVVHGCTTHQRVVDIEKGRIYLPLEDLQRFGVSEADIRTGRHPTKNDIRLRSVPLRIEGGDIYATVRAR